MAGGEHVQVPHPRDGLGDHRRGRVGLDEVRGHVASETRQGIERGGEVVGPQGCSASCAVRW
jgi:hypothetical protein